MCAKASLADSDGISTVAMQSYKGGYSYTISAWRLFYVGDMTLPLCNIITTVCVFVLFVCL